MLDEIFQGSTSSVLTPTRQNGVAKDPPVARLRAKLADLCRQQDSLAEAREQLLIDRESGLVKRRGIQKQRGSSRNAEIALMDAFRNHFVKLERPLPDELLDAYSKVQDHNLALRRMEEENMQEEEDLGASEWHFMEQETELYQYQVGEMMAEELGKLKFATFEGEVSTSMPLIPTSTGEEKKHGNDHAVVIEYNQLVSRFEKLRHQQSLRMDTYTPLRDHELQMAEDLQLESEIMHLAETLLDLIVSCETKMTKMGVKPNADRIHTPTRALARSEPSLRGHPWYENVDVVSRAHTENTAPQRMDSNSTSGMIANWSLDMLKKNAMEKLQYLNVLRSYLRKGDMISHPSPKFYHWEPLVTETWQAEHSDRVPGLEEKTSDEVDDQDDASKNSPVSRPYIANIPQRGSALQDPKDIEEGLEELELMYEAEAVLSTTKPLDLQVQVALVETVDFLSRANEDTDLICVVPLTNVSNSKIDSLLDATTCDQYLVDLDEGLLCVEKPNTGTQPLQRCDSAQGIEMDVRKCHLPAPQDMSAAFDNDLRFDEALMSASGSVRKYYDNVQYIHALWNVSLSSRERKLALHSPVKSRLEADKPISVSSFNSSRSSQSRYFDTQTTEMPDGLVASVKVTYRSRKPLRRGQVVTLPHRGWRGNAPPQCANELSAFIATKIWGVSASGVLIRGVYGERVWKSRPRFISIELLESFSPP